MANAKNNGQAAQQAAQPKAAVSVMELAPHADWSAVNGAEHFVQFYELDATLLNSLSGFIGAGLVAGEACVVVATPAHQEGLENCLRAYGLEVAAARASGQYVALDAAAVLAQFMVDGAPEPSRFAEVIGGVITRAAADNRRVRIFGEMVALLWTAGNQQAALRLEELWNRLHETHPFLLFCAYPMYSLGSAALAESFNHLCRAHSHVIPAESYTALDDSADRLRAIVALQQQASSLQAEIAERKAAEERVQRSQQELSDFVENAVVALHWVGPDGVIIWANRAEMELLGYSREEYIGHHIAEFHADRHVIEDLLQRLGNGAEIRNYAARLRCKDGSIKYALIDSNVYREEGEFIHTRCFTRDITEQRQAEQALRANEARLRQLLSLLPAAVYTCDSAGRITFYNQRAAELWGREPRLGEADERFCGSQRLRRLDGTPLPHTETPMALAVTTGQATRDEEVVIERPDGSELVVSVNIDPLYDQTGQRCGAINVLQDVTARERAAEALKQANRRKDEFLAMLAHELRNPLAPIRTAVQLLHRLGPPDPQLQQARDVIDRQAQHLTRLIEDLLDTARITQGKIALQRERLELRSAIGRALETTRPLMEARNHQLHVQLPPEPLWLEGDVVRLAQVIANLLNNAAKYTEQGGQIWLSVERAASEISLRVRDNGVGIAPALLPHIFELFTQAERSLDRSEGGLGIGLALVRSLVEMHGGRVAATSDGPGQGSEFIVHLPLLTKMPRETNTPPTATHQPATAPTSPCRVLVVDDNVDSAECITLFLRLSGHEVQMAHDGPTAIDAAKMFQPQVVLLDIGLPKLDGYEVARRLRAWPELQKAVFIALTGYGRTEDQRLSRQAGFDHHLVKPVDPEAVEALINSLVLC